MLTALIWTLHAMTSTLMRYSLLILFVFALSCGASFAQQPYPHLGTMKLTNNCGDEPNILIHYDKSLVEQINIRRSELDKGHIMHLIHEMGEYDIVALKLRFNNKVLKNEYYLVFSEGPSCDPGFYFYDITNKKSIGGPSGLEIYIPGGTSVYSTGHINSAFNKRRKYVFNGTKFEEIKPQFYYVGLKTKTLKPLSVYVDEELTSKLAQLPADYDIEVLAAKRNENYSNKTKYLVKTTLGLVGWSTIQAGAFTSIEVEGIKFIGD